MQSNIEKTLSFLYQQHGLGKTVVINGVLLTFDIDSSGLLQLFLYSGSEYESVPISINKTIEFPIVCPYIDKNFKDKILGCITKEEL
jgi:hypothetical protein